MLSTLTEPDSHDTTFDYDDNGNRTATHYPNGVTMTEDTDPRHQTMIDNVAHKTTTFGYDGLDRSGAPRR